MSSSCEVYSHGKVRFFRLAAILHDEGRELLILFLKTFYVGITLDAFLNKPTNKTKIDAALNKQVISHEQYLLLYPPTTADIRLYDITLLVFLIRSLHPSVPVYDKVWKCPSPGDRSMEAAVTNLRDIRNKLYSHIYELNISDADFKDHCSYLQGIFEILVSGIGDPCLTKHHIKDRIKNKTHASIDPDAENRLLNCLQSWKRFDNQEMLIEKLDELKYNFTSEIRALRETVCPLKEVRSVGTCTADHVECSPILQQPPISYSPLHSDDNDYEVPVCRISDSQNETHSDTITNAKCNDASTSTSTLEYRNRLSNRIRFVLCPFIRHTRVHERAVRWSSTESPNKCIDKKHSKLRTLSCLRSHRPYATVTKLHSYRHDDRQMKCFLSGLVHLMNGLLVIIDSTHNIIQVFDQSRVLIDVYKCKYPIKNTCVYKGDRQVAITLFKNHSVALYEITRKDGIKYLETLNVNCDSWLIDVKYRHGKLYTLCDKSEIHVHHFRSIPDDVIKFDIGVTPLSFDVAVVNEKTYLYVLHSDGVICFTDSGKEVWEHSFSENGENYELTYMCLNGGNLYITAWGINRVIELTKDGEWVRDIGGGVLSNPWALAVSETGEQIFVSQYNALSRQPNTRELLIFQ